MNWKHWFAWYPVFIGERIIWLRFIERSMEKQYTHVGPPEGVIGFYRYRLPK